MSTVNDNKSETLAHSGETSSGVMASVQDNAKFLTDAMSAISAMSKQISDQEAGLSAGASQLQALYQGIDQSGIDSIDFGAIRDQHKELLNELRTTSHAELVDFQALMQGYTATMEVFSALTSTITEMHYQYDHML